MSELGDRGALPKTGEHQRTGSSMGKNLPDKQTEGPIASRIEEQTSRIPSDAFLWAAGGSILGSVILQSLGHKHESLFVGQWAPTFLLLGIYNKLVKIAGHDRTHSSLARH